MPKRINNKKVRIYANKIFTDREEPRKSFWKCYNEVCENFNQDYVKVLTYYGIGGIGKSSLCRKIVQEINENEHDIKYLDIDFEHVSNEIDILYKMKKELCEKYNYSFKLFDYALYNYELKRGKDVNKPEIKSIIGDSKFLSTIFDVADAIPLTSSISAILKAVDSSTATVREGVKGIKKKIKEIEELSIEELRKHLVEYFIVDLNQNIVSEEIPMVVIFDTYEKLVNELSSVGNSIDNDLWLRGDNGLVLNCPNILWVLSGREKLKWKDFDKEWDEQCLEQHLIGGLSEVDARSFLKVAGIGEEDFIEQIVESADGIPYSLDLAVDTYFIIKEKGDQVSVGSFKGNYKLLSKLFLKYMNDNEKQLLYLLACMGSWTNEEFIEGNREMQLSICTVTYENIMGFSFIVSNKEKQADEYYIHNSMKIVMREQCSMVLRNMYIGYQITQIKIDIQNQECISLYKRTKKIIDNLFDVEDKKSIINSLEVVTNALEVLLEKYEFDRFLELKLEIDKLMKSKAFNETSSINILLLGARYWLRRTQFYKAISAYKDILNESKLSEENRILCYENLSYCCGKVCNDLEYKDAIYYAEEAIKLRKNNLIKYEKDLPIAYNSLAYVYFSQGKYNCAKELYQKSKELRENYYGKEHYRTIANVNNIAEILIKTGKYQDAEQILNECITILEKTQNEYFLYTLVCKINRIECKIFQNVTDNIIEQIEDCYEKISKVLGSDNEYSARLIDLQGDYFRIKQEDKKALKKYKLAYDRYVKIYGNDNSNTRSVVIKMEDFNGKSV